MPFFSKSILFIHIPKTGGTSVEKYFSDKFNIPLHYNSLYSFSFGKTADMNQDLVINSSLQHMTYNQIVKNNHIFNINFKNSELITIVRNPYERIISDLFWFQKINVESSKKEVFEIIKEYLISDNLDNHNIPQYCFITDENKNLIPNLHILRTESLTSDMKSLGYVDFNVVVNNNNLNVNYYNYLDDQSINLINEFYSLDFELFNYTKILSEPVVNETDLNEPVINEPVINETNLN